MATPSVSRILVDLEVKGGRITGLMAGGKGQAIRTLRIDLGALAGDQDRFSLGQQSQ